MPVEHPARIPGFPAVRPHHLVGGRHQGAQSVLDRPEVTHRLPYGYGKAAFRDLICMLEGGATPTVLLPAYVPDALVEAIRAADARPRFYAIESDLGPEVPDVVSKLDSEPVAATFVHYFGVPGRRFDEFRGTTADRDVPVVTDNAHASFSSDDDRLLGTRGVAGFTSLHKTLPVPNGAVLFVNDPDRVAVEEGDLAGRATRYTSSDCRFALESLLAGAGRRHPVLSGAVGLARRLQDRVASVRPQSGTERDPVAIYRAATGRMSRLTARVLERIDPAAIIAARRDAYRAWDDGLSGVGGVDPCFDALPPGAAPQVFPIVADDADGLLGTLDRRGVDGAHTWPPRLPAAVTDNEEYPVANFLASHLVALPCHQDVDPGAVEAVCAEL